MEIRMYKNGKVAGFGIYDGSMKDTVSLSENTFINQSITAHKPHILGQPLTYTSGEKYQIGVIAISQK